MVYFSETRPKALAIDAFSIKWKTEFYYIFPPFSLLGKAIVGQDESHCSDPQMAHTTLVPQPLEKSDKKHGYNTISKKFGTTPGSTKSSPTASKASPANVPDRLTMQDMINASLRKSTCQKHLSYQTRWKEHCAEKNILYDSPTAEQFLNFFTDLVNQGISHGVLISAKNEVAHVLRMKYQHIPQHPSVIKFFKGSFKLRPLLLKLSFVRDV